MTRLVALDTETSGLDHKKERILEIGCVEIVDGKLGKSWSTYLNPQQPVGKSIEIHGLHNDKLADMPIFAEKVESFKKFIGSSQLVIHNSSFDLRFLNAELARIGRTEITNKVICTLDMAKDKLPGESHKLDALCQRYKITSKDRGKHGALEDATLLAKMFLKLVGEGK